MESLMPFNNELLVREIVGFPVPVLVGIGHDKDVPLVALAADRAESTPTAVANLLNESWENALLLIERYERKILGVFDEIINQYKEVEHRVTLSLQKFGNTISNLRTKLGSYAQIYSSGFNYLLLIINEQLKNAEKIIEINNPERQLKLGYSIATVNGKIIRKTKDVKVGGEVDIKVSDGIISAEVNRIK